MSEHSINWLTSLICTALIFARITSGVSTMLVNLRASGLVRYNLSFRRFWAFFTLIASTEPSGNHPIPFSHSRSDLYTFYKKERTTEYRRVNLPTRAWCQQTTHNLYLNQLGGQSHETQGSILDVNIWVLHLWHTSLGEVQSILQELEQG